MGKTGALAEMRDLLRSLRGLVKLAGEMPADFFKLGYVFISGDALCLSFSGDVDPEKYREIRRWFSSRGFEVRDVDDQVDREFPVYVTLTDGNRRVSFLRRAVGAPSGACVRVIDGIQRKAIMGWACPTEPDFLSRLEASELYRASLEQD